MEIKNAPDEICADTKFHNSIYINSQARRPNKVTKNGFLFFVSSGIGSIHDKQAAPLKCVRIVFYVPDQRVVSIIIHR